MKKLKVGFICVHNSCRSQMAEAIARKFASDVIESYSAGTEVVAQINQQAVSTVKTLFDIDMSEQQSKLIEELPELDIVITMGCNVECPYVNCLYREDWGLDDPSGKSQSAFDFTANKIKENILKLKNRIENNEFAS